MVSLPTSPDPEAPFRLASFTVEPRLLRIDDGTTSRRLEPKVMRVLTCLAARPGDLVSRAELMDAAWGDVHVGEDPLNRAIAELRKLFGDRARSPRVIETIPKRGYRLLVPVERLTPPDVETKAAGVLPASAASSPGSAGRLNEGRRRIRSARGSMTAVVAVGLVLAAMLWARAQRSPAPPEPVRVVPLTSFPGREMSPALEPGGQRVAFVWTGGKGTNADVWLTQRGGEPLRLTDDPAPDHQPTWNPDGSSIIFLRFSKSHCEVLEVPAIGGPERRLYTCRGRMATGLDVAPDSRELIVADRHPDLGTNQLVRVDLASGDAQILTPATDAWSDELPRYAPDGRSIVFRRRRGSAASDLFRVAREGGTAVRLTGDGKDLGGHAPAAGGGWVVASNRGGGFELWRIDADGGSSVRLGYENAFLPSIGEQGLVFEQRSGDVDLELLEWRDGETPRGVPWGVSTRLDFDPAFAPGGRRVAFVSRRSGSDELWIAEMAENAAGEGGGAVQLTFFAAPAPGWLPAVAHPRFTADGEAVLIAARAGESYDLYAVPSGGGPPRRLTSEAGDERAPCAGPDGALYFVADHELGAQIWRRPSLDAPAGTARRLTANGAVAQLACPLSGTVFYRRAGEARVRRLSIDAGGETLADEPLGPRFIGPDWTATGDRLYGFVLGGDRIPSLASYRFADQRLESWALEEIRPAGGVVTARGGLAVRSDGAMALYARIVGDESDIMLVEGFR